MSATDFRRLIDVGGGGYISLEVDDPRADRPVKITLGEHGLGSASLALDYSTGGLLFDTLSQALAVVIAGQARPDLRIVVESALEATEHDTPGEAGS